MSERPVAIVTGGSAGIGATICRQMIDAGYEVVSVARRKPDWSHPALHAAEADLIDAKATGQVAADLARRFPISALRSFWYKQRCRACASGIMAALY